MESVHSTSTSIIKPKVGVRNHKGFHAFFRIYGQTNPHLFIDSFVDSSMEIPKIKKLFRSDVKIGLYFKKEKKVETLFYKSISSMKNKL